MKTKRPQGESDTTSAEAAGQPAYRVSLPEFEGPLDLLLHLCQTHELDILNIPMAFIAEKYIEYLERMENMSVEIAADYLVMAAHLAYLKSRELVPAPEPLEASEDGEEPVDPREELIRRLLEYQKYKHAAQSLGSRPIEGRNVFVRGVALQPEGEAGLAEHSVWKLLEHWARVLEKAKPSHTHDVVIDRISITDRVNQLVDLLEAGRGTIQFEDLVGRDLPEPELCHRLVVSLLAVLELARLRVIRIYQQEATGAFFLARVEGAALAEARNLAVTSAGGESGGATPARASPAAGPPATAASDPTRSLPQEDVISAPDPASAAKGENPSDGQTQAEQKTTGK
ncbi:MAG: segregation/condensation protein A [Deltaproteobacteria bacterium]|nr:segregation/condensation protein A [Deltaproteobacteria bacterium]